MSDFYDSYDYQNKVRDLGDAFRMIVQKVPVLAALVGAPLIGLDGQPLRATNTKHEWLEDSVSPNSWTVNGTRNTGGATLTLVSTAGVVEGMVLGFEGADGASKTVQLIVTEVTNTTTLAVSVYGGSTDVQLDATDVVKLVGRPRPESTDPEASGGSEPSVEYNYTQIFDRVAKVSKTSESVKKYGIASALDYQVERKLWELAYEMNNAIIYGRRVQRTSPTVPGSMGGLLYFLEAGSNNKVDAAGDEVSPSILNDAFEQGLGQGAVNMTTLLCNVNQARKISAFNTTGNNPVVVQDSKTAGSYVLRFLSDIPMGENGMISQIVVDQNFPKDKIALLDTNEAGVVPLQGREFTDEDATPPGADYFQRRILGEYTLEFKNKSKSHQLIHDLDV